MTTTKTELQSWRHPATLFSNNPSVGNQSIAPVTSKTASRTTGDNIKGWRRRIENHQDATTSLDGTRYTYTRHPYTYYVKMKNGYTYLATGKLDTSSVPSSVNATLESQVAAIAKQKFASDARNKIHSFQGGVFAGELRETAQLLASPTKRLRKEVGSLLKFATDEQRKVLKAQKALARAKSSFWRDPKAKARAVRKAKANLNSLRNVLADTWLEWSFGVKPIIQDANDAAEAFRRLVNGERFEALHIKGSHSVETRSILLNTTGFSFGFSGMPQYARHYIEERDHCEYTIRADYIGQNPNATMPLPAIFGLDLSSIAPTAWELIPWSFFVDYFTDVGNAIDAWSIRLINFAWSNHSVRNRRSYISRYKDLVYSPVDVTYATFDVNGPYLAKGTMYTVKRRSDLPAIEPYKPILKIPGYTSTKYLNIAALASGILTLKRQR